MKKHLKWLIPLFAVAIVAIAAAVAPIFHLTNTIVHESDHVSVRKVTPAEETKQIYAQMSPLTEDTVFQYPLIVSGVVKNIREVEISYSDYGREKTKCVTLFDLKVTEYLKNSSPSLKEKRVLTLGHSLSSYQWISGAPELTEGGEYILFCYVFADDPEPEPMYTHEYSDAWITDPVRLIIAKDGEAYNANEFFKVYAGDSKASESECNSLMTFRAPADAFETYIREHANADREVN